VGGDRAECIPSRSRESRADSTATLLFTRPTGTAASLPLPRCPRRLPLDRPKQRTSMTAVRDVDAYLPQKAIRPDLWPDRNGSEG
jgi:hypothetical protein